MSFDTIHNNGVSGTTADLFGIGYVYNLSKRTAMYGAVAHIKNGSATNYGTGAGNADTGVNAGFVVSGGSSVNSFQVGLRHGF